MFVAELCPSLALFGTKPAVMSTCSTDFTPLAQNSSVSQDPHRHDLYVGAMNPISPTKSLRRRLRVLITVLSFALLVVACGSSTSDDTATPATDAQTTEPAVATAVEPDDADADSDHSEDDHSDEDHSDEDHSDDDHDHSDDDDHDHSETAGVDVGLFFDGALTGDATTEECTLSGGAVSTCLRLTASGAPVTYETGPFCPDTIDDTTDAGGIWFDGNGVYELDGEFIVGLAELYDDDNWLLYNEDGTINVTETAEEFDLAARPNVDPSLQNHCVEGQLAWLDNGEPVTSSVVIPAEPVLADAASSPQGNWGVTLDGVVIAASAPVDAILGAYTIAAFDDCGGHYNPTDGYHLHGAVGCSELEASSADETPMFAYAMDGFPIHSPLDDPSAFDLDECNGHTTEEDGYHYHANNAAENQVLECLMGQTVATGGDAGAAGGRPDRPERPENGAAPGAGEEQEGAVAASTETQDGTSTVAGVEAAQWSDNVTITVSGNDSFRFESDGLPSHELPDQFLIPNEGNMPPFTGDDIAGEFSIANTAEILTASPLDVEITVSPVYSDTATDTSLSTIGVMISGAPIFNDYEDMSREFVALDDNLSLDGVYFIDACNGHPLASGASYHYHGVPYCITDTVDVPGEHSTIIGVLLDGFPVYGSSDVGGVALTNADLDECSGHFGPTPEFPEGIYHYHLTEDASPYSIDCFHGVIDYGGGGPGGAGGPGGGDRPPRPEGGPPAGDGGPPAGQDATADETAAATPVDPDELATRAEVALAAQWADNVDISVDGSSLIFESDGLPSHEYLDVYLADGRDGKYIAGGVDSYNASFEILLVPQQAGSPTQTPGGAIGVAISGAVFFDPYEGDGSGTVANDDNETIDGIPFIDACGGHPLPNGISYHYHGIPFCITDALDEPGQHSEIIGYLFDGYPIYGPQDVDGEEPTDLDECHGHVGETPEFEGETYHYHVTSSDNYISECFTGVS